MGTRITVERSGETIAVSAGWARTGKERRNGLLGRDRLDAGEGLIIERAPQVHTFRMRFPIDAVFCDRSWAVRHVVNGMRPGRITRYVLGARYCIELPSGAAAGVERGDTLRLESE